MSLKETKRREASVVNKLLEDGEMKLTKYEKTFIDQLALDIKESGITKEGLTEEKLLRFIKDRYERNNKLALFALNNPKAQKVIKIVSGANVYKKIHQQNADNWAERELTGLGE